MEYCIVSSGVPSARSSGSASVMPSTVTSAPIQKDSSIAVRTARDTASASPAPACCEMTTAAPDDSPTKKPTMRLMMTKSDPPTAASAVLPTCCPRITASTIE